MKKIVIALFMGLIFQTAHGIEIMNYTHSQEFAPFAWKQDGLVQGIWVDIVNNIMTKHLKIPVNHKVYPWVRAQMLVEKGLADGFITAETETRKKYALISSEDVMRPDWKIYTGINNPRRRELAKIKSIDQLKKFKLVSFKGNGWAEAHFKNMNVEWFTSVTGRIYTFLLQGKADAYVNLEPQCRYEIKRLGYQNKIIEMPSSVDNSAFYFYIGKKSAFKDKMPQINEIIRKIRKDGTLDKIYAKYVNSPS